jgi:hypothetical protein
MLRRNFLKNLGLLSVAPVTALQAATPAGNDDFVSVGVNGKVTDNGKPIANVGVSDGFQIVYTGKDGSYQLSTHVKARFVFVILPSGYEIPNEKGVARFYQAVDKGGKQQKVNFELKKLTMNDDRHAFLVWGDTQIQGKYDATQLKTVSAPDTKAHIATLGEQPIHGIGCGDLVFDHFELFDDYKQAVATTGIPFFQLIGNHDMDYTARTDDGSQATYNSHFGPTYYSYNRGKIHYVVLDNVFFIGQGHRYIGYLTEDQLSWLERDLAVVPKGTTLVVSLHIPVYNKLSDTKNAKDEALGAMTSNREALYALLKEYKVHFMTAHTHFNENWEKDNMYEHNHGTVCGAWWCGPVCGDGTPNGYAVYQVNGSELTWYFKSTGFDKNHQLTIHKKGADKSQPDALVVNVWNWDEKWKVEWMEDGKPQGELKNYVGFDPQAVELYLGPVLPKHHKWVEPSSTDHLFAITPSAAAKEVTVKVTDRFGNVYTESAQV